MECTGCSSSKKYKIFSSTSWLGALFVALVPKCSLCVVAYSSAITVCGGQELYLEQSSWLSVVPLFLCLITFIMIIMNRRGLRTVLAAFLVIVASLIFYNVRLGILNDYYYHIASATLFSAVWLNTSFLSVLNQFKPVFKITKKKVIHG